MNGRVRSPRSVRVRIGDVVRSGTVIDLRDVVRATDDTTAPLADRLLDRIRPPATVDDCSVTDDAAVDAGRRSSAGTTPVTVRCVRPTTPTALDRVPSGRSLHELLAIAARERGHTASVDARLARRRRRLHGIDPPTVDVAEARRRVAETGAEIDRLRERAATIRGELTARRELGEDRGDVREELEGTLAELSEAETSRIAATQDLDRARREARRARDRRERRLELADEVANLERSARRELVEAVHPTFRSALERLPVTVQPGSWPTEVRGSSVVAELVAIAIAGRRAPVVLVEGMDGSTEKADGSVAGTDGNGSGASDEGGLDPETLTATAGRRRGFPIVRT
ncbi:DUF7856 family protein [Halopenitus persicus]|uniref:Uncharacterized protein n=1 Tax=Halopenitus persicus TaxID=1048396 RepID=A0A1H3FRB3_9EURY|nr:hypothetical protein [Halopenitus persicus]SDX93612.1 hypothetical protein SAMN05216564_102182 [Halopenitus persicus]